MRGRNRVRGLKKIAGREHLPPLFLYLNQWSGVPEMKTLMREVCSHAQWYKKHMPLERMLY